ncbi:hypothetical protein GCM10009765_05280 [Fodinicola feengrottensis]|uniref:SH3 domain-containing protein n=2 Tax=Fodinicola feengrottensis TaxID=435914 RepID=A0ABP4RP11_9ACTN
MRFFRVAVMFFATAGLLLTGSVAANADQHGFDAVICHADTAYIYQYEDTGSARLDALPRGAHFQVYHQDGGWDFGVRNYNGVSGYVLSDKLCSAAKQAIVAAPAVSGDRRCVDVPNGYIRNYPAGQAWTQLDLGQTFSVYEYRDSGWARGYAWGHVMTDQSPFPAPYNDVWIQTSNLGKHVNDGSTCS